ncbi:MAG: sugar phosphate isomerase/epimerase family protein [Eubacteriales bacterium]|jgi:sugar phosphate isomerase/epimerase
MKISCLPVSLFSQILSGEISLRKWAEIGKESGLDGIDFSSMFITSHTPVFLREVGEALQEVGMPLVMVTTYPDFTHPSAVQRERELCYLEYDFAVASQLGAKYVRVLAGQAHPGVTREQGISWAVENLKRATQLAAKYNIIPVYENHAKPGAWDYIDFSHPVDIFTEIYEKTEDVGLRVNFDTANVVAAGSDTLALLQKVLPRLETVHGADSSTWGTLTHCMLGEGLSPLKEIFSMLKQHGFDGWICIEEGSGRGPSGIAQATQYVRSTWDVIQ